MTGVLVKDVAVSSNQWTGAFTDGVSTSQGLTSDKSTKREAHCASMHVHVTRTVEDHSNGVQ